MPSTVALAFAALLRGQFPWDLLAGATPQEFRVDTPARLDEFMNATMGVPLWKIGPLLEQHAVLVTRDGAGVSCAAATPLRAGDKVRLTSPLPAALATQLQQLADAGAKDVALVPPPRFGAGDPFINGIRPLIQRRPNTIWLNPPLGTEAVLDSLEEFVHAVTTDTDSTAPIRDVFLVSHANPGGALFVRLRGNEDISVVTYERLQQAVTGGFLRFPHEAFDPRPLAAGNRRRPRVILLGCDVGRAVPFLTKLKEAFGGEVDVLAPRHHDTVSLPDSSGAPPFQLFEYRFDVVRPQAIARRADLLDAYRGRARRPWDAPFELIDESTVADGIWSTWLPSAIPVLPGVDAAPTESTRPRSWPVPFPPGTRSRDVRLQVFRPSFPVSLTIHGTSDPGSLAARKALVASQLPAADGRFDASHEFPVWVRTGQRTLDEFMDTWDWQFRFEAASGTLTYTATRVEYTLLVPIVDPASGILLVNRYTDAAAEAIEQVTPATRGLFGTAQ